MSAPDETAPVLAQQDAAGQGDEIIVTGIRRSFQTSQTIKRDSEAIVDAIVAEDIGKLPDISAAASLARLPGVQTSRAGAEAFGIQVRGLPDVATTYNGREIFTGVARGVAIQDFPAGQIAGLEVYKSSTANLVEPGIGGLVNVRSRRPFDFDGLEIFGSVQGYHFEQSTETTPAGNVLLSDRWDTPIGEIGVLVSASTTQLHPLDSIRESDQFVTTATPEQTDITDLRYPANFQIVTPKKDIRRPSATFAVQWKPASDLEIFTDGLFQGYRGSAADQTYFVPIDGVLSNVELMPGTSQAQRMTVTGASAPLAFQSSIDERTNTYQLATGFRWTPDRLTLSGDVAYDASTYGFEQANVDFAFASAPTFDVDFDTPRGSGGPVLAFRDFDTVDPGNYIFRGLADRRFRTESDGIQARLDAEYETGWEALTRVQVGFRYIDRSVREANGDRYSATDPITGQPFVDLGIPLGSVADPVGSWAGFRFDEAQRQRRFLTVTKRSIDDNLDALRSLVGFDPGLPAYNDLQRFEGSEKGYSVYGQAKYGFDIAGMTLDGLFGLRIVRTDARVDGTLRTETPSSDPAVPNEVTFTPISESRSYVDYLPNFSARLEMLEALQLRFAYTHTRTRPNFSQLSPTSNITPVGPDGFVNISSGNPDLEPLRSKNYDLSLEWYPRQSSSLTLALFRREVKGFIFNVVSTILDDPGDPTAGGTRISSPRNSGEGLIRGIEVAGQTTFDFDFVPQWARYFGLAANYTYIDATSELPGSDPEQPGNLSLTLPGQQPLGGVSRHSYNLTAFYERPEFSIRTGYNWRSRYTTFYRNPPNVPAENPLEFDRPEFEEARGTLDLGMTVTPRENVTLFFDAINLLGNPRRFTNPYNPQGDSFDLRRQYIERIYSAGVRFRF